MSALPTKRCGRGWYQPSDAGYANASSILGGAVLRLSQGGIYLTLVEHPARMECGTTLAATDPNVTRKVHAERRRKHGDEGAERSSEAVSASNSLRVAEQKNPARPKEVRGVRHRCVRGRFGRLCLRRSCGWLRYGPRTYGQPVRPRARTPEFREHSCTASADNALRPLSSSKN